MPTEAAPRSRHLVDILRSLPAGELNALIARLGVRIDPAKRIDPAAQVGRILVALPEVREPSRLPAPAVELLHRIAEAGGSLVVPAAPHAAEVLQQRGIVFGRPGHGGGVELVLPTAYLLQLRSWESEDPRSLRALLAQAPLETLSAIASHYLGRPATPPVALSLELAWDVLGSPEKLAEEIKRLGPTERRVLDGVEREGGEVDTEELLELEREPMRLRTATGATPSRRGVGFAVERRGLLIPMHPNRHVIPREVSAIIGAASMAEREARRQKVRAFVEEGDHAPRRARFAQDPAPLALGLALAAREHGSEVRPGVGTPRSLLAKLATRFGRDQSHVALVAALSRAIGLWDPSAASPSAPPGSLPLAELTRVLFEAWQRGGAWDEARAEPEVLRAAEGSRDASPAHAVRDMVTEALQELGDGRWVPWTSLAGYLKTDRRVPGVARLLRRWSERVNVPAVEPLEVARRIVLESLPALGIVDLGEQDADSATPPSDGEPAPPSGPALTLRLTPRGRALITGTPLQDAPAASKFLDTHVLRLGPGARVASVLAIAPFVEVGRAAESLDLIVAPQTLARALSAGLEADTLRSRIEAVAPLPETLSRTLAQASVVVGRTSFVPTAGFLWVEDANVRELLRTRRTTAELFVDPSPPSGLLVLPTVDLERLVRRCRTVGVEVVLEGHVVRAKSVPPPARLTPARGTDK